MREKFAKHYKNTIALKKHRGMGEPLRPTRASSYGESNDVTNNVNGSFSVGDWLQIDCKAC